MQRLLFACLVSVAASACSIALYPEQDHEFLPNSPKSTILFGTSTNQLCPEYMLAFGSKESLTDHRGVFSAVKKGREDEVEPLEVHALLVEPKAWGVKGFFPSSMHEFHHLYTHYFVPVESGEVVYAGNLVLTFDASCLVATLAVIDASSEDLPKLQAIYPGLRNSKISKRLFNAQENEMCSGGVLGTDCF